MTPLEYRGAVFTAGSTTDLEASEEGRALLQQRVASFGLAGGIASLSFLAFRAAVLVVRGDYVLLLRPDMLAHLAGGLVVLGMWLFCRRGQRSARYARTVETIGLVGGSIAFELMGTAMNINQQLSTHRAPAGPASSSPNWTS